MPSPSRVVKAYASNQIQEATVISCDSRDARSVTIRTSGGSAIRRCQSTLEVKAGQRVMVVMNRYDNTAQIIGVVQNQKTLAASGSSSSAQAINPPSGQGVNSGVRQIAFHWNFYPGNDQICYQVQHNAVAAEDGSQEDAIITKGSYFVYDCTTSVETRYFRVRAMRWMSQANVMVSPWGEWVSGTSYDLQVEDIPNLPTSIITSGTLPIARGGTGAGNRAGAINSLLPSQSGQSGNVLNTDGDNVFWGAGGSGGGGNIAIANLPCGSMVKFAGGTIPDGWLECDGSEVSRATYADLFTVIGTTFGTPGGGSTATTTFYLPDMSARFPMGRNWENLLGETGGESAHFLTGDEVPHHTHTVDNGLVGTTVGLQSTGGEAGVTDSTTYATSATNAHNNLPPFLVVMYIIKYTALSIADLVFDDTDAPKNVATSANEGNDVWAARRDHVHSMPSSMSALFGNVPSSASDTGVTGRMALDATHLYICVATNTWTRVALVW